MEQLFNQEIEIDYYIVEQKGIEKKETILGSLIKIVKNGGYGFDKAMDILEIPIEDRPFYRERDITNFV